MRLLDKNYDKPVFPVHYIVLRVNHFLRRLDRSRQQVSLPKNERADEQPHDSEHRVEVDVFQRREPHHAEIASRDGERQRRKLPRNGELGVVGEIEHDFGDLPEANPQARDSVGRQIRQRRHGRDLGREEIDGVVEIAEGERNRADGCEIGRGFVDQIEGADGRVLRDIVERHGRIGGRFLELNTALVELQ